MKNSINSRSAKKREKIISDILKKHNITLSFLENKGRAYYILHGVPRSCNDCKFSILGQGRHEACAGVPALHSAWETKQYQAGEIGSYRKIGCLWKYLPK